MPTGSFIESLLSKALIVSLVAALVLAVPASALAQARGQAAGESAAPSAGGPRKQLATIIYAGLGGAVLGLSTLSFYGRPQDKLANIAIGFAVGVIIGTSVVTYGAATNPDEFYGTGDGREAWRYEPSTHESAFAGNGASPRTSLREGPPENTMPVLSYAVSF